MSYRREEIIVNNMSKNEILELEIQWDKEELGNSIHRNKFFYKTGGLFPFETRIGLLRETPNKELMLEIEKRISWGEIDLPSLIKYLESKQKNEK